MEENWEKREVDKALLQAVGGLQSVSVGGRVSEFKVMLENEPFYMICTAHWRYLNLVSVWFLSVLRSLGMVLLRELLSELGRYRVFSVVAPRLCLGCPFLLVARGALATLPFSENWNMGIISSQCRNLKNNFWLMLLVLSVCWLIGFIFAVLQLLKKILAWEICGSSHERLKLKQPWKGVSHDNLILEAVQGWRWECSTLPCAQSPQSKSSHLQFCLLQQEKEIEAC